MKYWVRAAVIGAVYVVLIFAFRPLSFGPVQFRVAEALTVLPIIYPEAIPGLFVGVLLGNILGEVGVWDVIGGSLATLIAAYLTYRYRNSWFAYASPIVCNALLVSLYLHVIVDQSYWLVALTIALGEAGVVLLLGIPLIKYLQRIMHNDIEGKRL